MYFFPSSFPNCLLCVPVCLPKLYLSYIFQFYFLFTCLEVCYALSSSLLPSLNYMEKIKDIGSLFKFH
jgi:hypothetical protein